MLALAHRDRIAAAAALSLGWLLVWAAPLAGLAAAGRPLAAYLDFPPRAVPLAQAPFAWGAFALLALPAIAAAALYGIALARTQAEKASVYPRGFPWWGWLGAALIAAGWMLAWSELVAPQWRRHTFTPLWLGYVIAVNALAFRRSGRAPLTHGPGLLLALFPASALFWWLFEHLNQFVGNWHYTGVAAAGDWDYFLQATLPFSSVLPAVASTWAWLGTYPRFAALGQSMPFTLPAPGRTAAALAVLIGLVLLAGLGLRPQALFGLLWIAPLAVLLGLQKLLVGETLLAPLARGDWRALLQPAAAALVCGFFWELWNWGSLARWHYAIPYAQRFHLFEMPLLGYAGYLPFGVECAVFADLVARMLGVRAQSPSGR